MYTGVHCSNPSSKSDTLAEECPWVLEWLRSMRKSTTDGGTKAHPLSCNIGAGVWPPSITYFGLASCSRFAQVGLACPCGSLFGPQDIQAGSFVDFATWDAPFAHRINSRFPRKTEDSGKLPRYTI